jgi:hypothetical protein
MEPAPTLLHFIFKIILMRLFSLFKVSYFEV